MIFEKQKKRISIDWIFADGDSESKVSKKKIPIGRDCVDCRKKKRKLSVEMEIDNYFFTVTKPIYF